MANIAMLEGWTITSVETIENYDRTTETLLSVLDEIKTFTLSNTEEQSEVTGKNGQALFTIKKNKAVNGSGASGYISGNLMALQTGSEATEGTIKFRKHESKTLANNATKFVTEKAASGTAGSEILSLLVTVNGTTTAYSQATTATTGKFSYNPSSREVTLPTDLTIPNGATVDVVYDYEETGAKVGNKSGTYGKTTHTFINCLGKNKCDEVYQVQIEIYRADWNANFDFELGGDGAEHPFQFTSLVDKCVGDNAFWDFKVYKSAN